MRLARGRSPGAMITLTPLVDVMLILLVFFMVTSTYLDLDMIPVGVDGEAPGGGGEAAETRTVLLRIDAAGRPVLRGEALSPDALAARLSGVSRALILPSGGAAAQDLVRVMEAAARAGVADARIVRIEGEGGG